MATKLTGLARNFVSMNKLQSSAARKQILTVAKRNVHTSFKGAIPAEPVRENSRIPLFLVMVFVGTYLGQALAKYCAGFLEETEMFVPDDDDD